MVRCYASRGAPSPGTLDGCATGWEELLNKQSEYMAVCLHAAVSAGGSFRSYARAGRAVPRVPWLPVVGNHEFYDGEKLHRYLNQTEVRVRGYDGE